MGDLSSIRTLWRLDPSLARSVATTIAACLAGQSTHHAESVETALPFFSALHDIERDAADLNADDRYRLRQSRAKPLCDALHE